MSNIKHETAPPTTSTPTPRVTTVASLAGVCLERDVPTEDLADYIRDPDTVVWMDVLDPGPTELEMLQDTFGFHPLALEDVANGRQRPKVDEYKDHLFVVTLGVAPALGEGAGAFETYEVDLFIGRTYVVSLHRGRRAALDHAFERWTGGGVMLKEGVGFLVYSIMDAIIDEYFPITEAIENALDEHDQKIFNRSDESAVQGLFQLKRSLFLLRRTLSPMRETFNVFLRRDRPLFTADTLTYFQDVYDQVLRILDVVDTEREMVTGVLDEHLMVISNRLNVTMKTLTVISALVGTVGCVFGAWGMNVGGVPFQGSHEGFWGILLGSVGVTTLALLLGRKKGWL